MAGPGLPTLPPDYRRRMIQGVAAWGLLVLGIGAWVAQNAGETRSYLNSRIPQASAPVKAVYLTPQIKDSPGVTFGGDAVPPPSGQGAYVSLIMTDLGLSSDLTERAIEDLPEDVALAFSPYGDLAKWIKQAKGAKHEALVLLPMEPHTYPKDDPGPKALLTRISSEDNAEKLAAILKQSNGAVGVMNFMGSEFLSDKKTLTPVLEALQKAGASFIENSEKPTNASAVAAETRLPYISTDIAIDSSATETDVGGKLVELERLARQNGHAVGVATPYPVTFNMIKTWARDLEARGVRLIPLSAMMKVKARADTSRQNPDDPPAQPPRPE